MLEPRVNKTGTEDAKEGLLSHFLLFFSGFDGMDEITGGDPNLAALSFAAMRSFAMDSSFSLMVGWSSSIEFKSDLDREYTLHLDKARIFAVRFIFPITTK